MKPVGKIAACLTCMLALNGSHANDCASPNNPYAPIVARNVFGLNPPPSPESEQTSDPPSKITPNGIMSIFGQLQVLFKVDDTKPGQPLKDKFYTLSEGERQDDIEITQINEKASVVTFNNHGTVQEIPLANTSAVSVSEPNGSNIRRGHMDNRSFHGSDAGGNIPIHADYSSQLQPQNTMTPEMQTILIAAQVKAQQENIP